MRKQIKVLVSVIAVVCMVAALMIPSFAADEGKIQVTGSWNSSATEKDGVKTVTLDNGTVRWTGLGDMGVQVQDGRTDAIGLGPVTKEDKVDLAADVVAENAKNAYIEFEFTVESAGDYTLTLDYSAGSVKGEIKRAADVKVNGGEAMHLEIKDHSSWNTADDDTTTFTAHLNKGTNKITFVNPVGFDNGQDGGTTHTKAINIIALGWKLTKADAVDTQAPADTQKPADTTGSTGGSGSSSQGPSAPATGFATAAIVLGIAATGAYICSKKH